MAPLVLDMFALPRALVGASEADRLAALKRLARPLLPDARLGLAPLAARDDLLLQLEFLGWIVLLAANPVSGAACVAAGALYRRPLLAVLGDVASSSPSKFANQNANRRIPENNCTLTPVDKKRHPCPFFCCCDIQF